ncbi:hypothetical protein ACWCQP_50335 [Streptomyces chartreusis]
MAMRQSGFTARRRVMYDDSRQVVVRVNIRRLVRPVLSCKQH